MGQGVRETSWRRKVLRWPAGIRMSHPARGHRRRREIQAGWVDLRKPHPACALGRARQAEASLQDILDAPGEWEALQAWGMEGIRQAFEKAAQERARRPKRPRKGEEAVRRSPRPEPLKAHRAPCGWGCCCAPKRGP